MTTTSLGLASVGPTQVPPIPQADPDAAADSLNQTLEQIGQSVTQTGEMLLEGRWSEAVHVILSSLIESLAGLLPSVASAIFVGVVFYGLFRFVLGVSQRVLHRSPRVGPGLEHLLVRTLSVAGIVFILILVLSQLGLNVAALIAGLGIAGIAVGFAAQDTLANFIAGVTILLDRPFSVGDYVEIDQTYGEVVELTLRSTTIRTPQNRVLVVPNTTAINRSLTNFSSAGPSRALRVDIPFGIAYKERPAEAREVIVPLVQGDGRILAEPEPHVIVSGLGDSSIDMMLRIYLKDSSHEQAIRSHYTERIREALRDADIEIPFPHLQLFIDEAKGLSGEGAPPIRFAAAGG